MTGNPDFGWRFVRYVAFMANIVLPATKGVNLRQADDSGRQTARPEERAHDRQRDRRPPLAVLGHAGPGEGRGPRPGGALPGQDQRDVARPDAALPGAGLAPQAG